MVANHVAGAGCNFQPHAGVSAQLSRVQLYSLLWSAFHCTVTFTYPPSRQQCALLKSVVVGSETLQRRTAWGHWMKRKDLTGPPSHFLAGGWNKLLHLYFWNYRSSIPLGQYYTGEQKRTAWFLQKKRREKKDIAKQGILHLSSTPAKRLNWKM